MSEKNNQKTSIWMGNGLGKLCPDVYGGGGAIELWEEGYKLALTGTKESGIKEPY